MRFWRTWAVCFCVCFLAGVEAHADVPPPDACSKAGSACENAGNNYDQPGVCKKSSCSRVDPTTGQQTSYECFRCYAEPGARPATSERKSSGCQLAPGTQQGALAALLLVAGGWLFRARRRR